MVVSFDGGMLTVSRFCCRRRRAVAVSGYGSSSGIVGSDMDRAPSFGKGGYKGLVVRVSER